MEKMSVGNDSWSSFAGVEGLCETKMLRVCLARHLAAAGMPAGSGDSKRADWAASHCSVFIDCESL